MMEKIRFWCETKPTHLVKFTSDSDTFLHVEIHQNIQAGLKYISTNIGQWCAVEKYCHGAKFLPHRHFYMIQDNGYVPVCHERQLNAPGEGAEKKSKIIKEFRIPKGLSQR